jgi:ubiquitin-activating enzyme E1
VQEPKTLAFRSLAEALAAPGEFLLTDFSKMERSGQLHAGFQALHAFEAKHGRSPAPAHAADAAELQALAAAVNEASADKVELDAPLLATLAHNAGGELSPMAAMFGGMVGQEARCRSAPLLLLARRCGAASRRSFLLLLPL